jgi:hypothetical protein
MNMHLQPQRTQAETALIDAFGERQSLLPGDGAVMVKRDEAIERVKHGLPTRRVESWHYTDLRRLLTSVPSYDDSAKAAAIAPLVEGSPVLAVLNGIVAKAPALDNVTVAPVSEKLIDGTYAPALAAQGDDDAIGALNAALVADGWFLDIDALKIVADGINSLRSPDRSIVVITHYQRLLEHIVPDTVHVLYKGQVIKSGDKSLALELEANGYAGVIDEAA